MIEKIKGVLTLVRVQSIPVTSVSLGLGYASVNGTVVTGEIIPLVIIGALGHMGHYGANDVFDYKWDKEQGRSKKPIVSGDISRSSSSFISSMIVALSITGAYEYFTTSAFILWVIASILGLVYNIRSKKDIYAGTYLGLWGIFIILTGSLYAGSITGTSIILALLLGVHMFWMTIMGNIKDIETGEESIPNKLGCKLIDKGGTRLVISTRLSMFTTAVVFLEVLLLILLPIANGAQHSDVISVYLAIIFSVGIIITSDTIVHTDKFDRDDMKKRIAKHEIVTVIAIVVVGLSFFSVISALVMLIGSVIWGTVCQIILYKHPLRFP